MPPNRSLHPTCYDWLRPQVNFSVERLLQVGVFGQRESRTGPIAAGRPEPKAVRQEGEAGKLRATVRIVLNCRRLPSAGLGQRSKSPPPAINENGSMDTFAFGARWLVKYRQGRSTRRLFEGALWQAFFRSTSASWRIWHDGTCTRTCVGLRT